MSISIAGPNPDGGDAQCVPASTRAIWLYSGHVSLYYTNFLHSLYHACLSQLDIVVVRRGGNAGSHEDFNSR